MPRLTPQHLHNTPTPLNALKQRLLPLRSQFIPVIENLETLADDIEVYDLTGNEIVTLGNLPTRLRLKSILIARNRISVISEDLSETVPNLESLSLISNKITEWVMIKRLHGCKRLKTLYLQGNPISTQSSEYRLFTIWLIPSLEIFDGAKVKQAERNQATELYGEDWESRTPLVDQLLDFSATSPAKINTVSTTQAEQSNDIVSEVLEKLSDEDRERLKTELRNATSLAEIERIEEALRTGYI